MDRLTISVKEMSQQLGISLPKAYDLTFIKGFPVLHVGRRKIIPVEGLSKWIESASYDDAGYNSTYGEKTQCNRITKKRAVRR